MLGLQSKFAAFRTISKHVVLPAKNVAAFTTCMKLFGARKVLGGPFEGMRYSARSYGSELIPKVLGTYEKELAEFWKSTELDEFKTIIDIGCADGYYLAGIAHCLRKRGSIANPRFIGYDINKEALDEAGRLMEANGVCNYELKVDGFEADLEVIVLPALVICDIEGQERELLNPHQNPTLRKCHMLVEIHDTPGQSDTLDCIINRFYDSHVIKRYRFLDRTLDDFPRLPWPRVHDRLKLELMDEKRMYGKNWLWMRPKSYEALAY